MGDNTTAAIPHTFLYRIDGSLQTFARIHTPVPSQVMATAQISAESHQNTAQDTWPGLPSGRMGEKVVTPFIIKKLAQWT